MNDLIYFICQVKKVVIHNSDVAAKEEEDIAKGMFCFFVYFSTYNWKL